MNDVLAQTSVKVNDVVAHPGKRCRDTWQVVFKLSRTLADIKYVGVPFAGLGPFSSWGPVPLSGPFMLLLFARKVTYGHQMLSSLQISPD